jgi:hypothetical protein
MAQSNLSSDPTYKSMGVLSNGRSMEQKTIHTEQEKHFMDRQV